PGFPGSFFVVDFPGFGPRSRFHAPETTCAVNVPAVGDKEQLRTVRGPRRADLMIALAVVVARQGAAAFAGHLLHVLQRATRERSRKNVEAPVIGGRHERNAPAVWRETRFYVNRA